MKMIQLQNKINYSSVNIKWCALALTGAALFSPQIALAAGGNSGSIADLKWPWVNFGIYVCLISYFLRKPLATAWKSRRELMISLVGGAKKEAEAARKYLIEAEAKMNALDAELLRIAADIEKEGTREAADIVLDAKNRAQRIVSQGKDLAQAELRSTEEALRREIVEQALKRAETQLRSDLNIDTDKPLREVALGAVRELVQ